jgi:hypothetical protein
VKGHIYSGFGFGLLTGVLVCAAGAAMLVYFGTDDCGALRLPSITMGNR